MLKKTGRDILILFCFAALWSSTSRSAMEYISSRRSVPTWWGVYDWLYGNLSGMSHLDFVKRFRTPEDYSGKRPVYNVPKNIALFLQGDSYTRHPQLKDINFAGVSEFHFFSRGAQNHYHMDTTKRNLLIIEIAESRVRETFRDLKTIDEICDGEETENINKKNDLQPAITKYCSPVPDIKLDRFFNKHIGQNLEFNLFNYNFMVPLFGSKAAINYYLFDRASGDITISDDGNFLFIKETVSDTDDQSSFSKISATDIGYIVDNLNKVYRHYRTAGFKEVYLSIIPNNVSIMEPEKYNRLTPLIQNDTRNEMKIIDLYSVYKNSGASFYLPGDTHWNDMGFLVWLKTVNEKLLNAND